MEVPWARAKRLLLHRLQIARMLEMLPITPQAHLKLAIHAYVLGISGVGFHLADITSWWQIDWANEDTSLLLKYRHSNRLVTPTAFHSQEHAAVLSVPGIGRYSPSMVRKRTKKIVPKEQLAVAVRRHFHGLPMNEQEVIGDLIYTVKNQDKIFKLRFTPI